MNTDTEVETLECGCDLDAICHEQTCHDRNLSICGEDLSEATLCNDCKAPSCVVCDGLGATEDASSDPFCSCVCCLDAPCEVTR